MQCLLEAIPLETECPYEFRNRVILEVMYTCALRRSDVVNLHLADFDREQKSLFIRAKNSKTNMGRLVPVGEIAFTLLCRYIDEIRPPVFNQFLFLSNRKKSLNAEAITTLVRRLKNEISLKSPVSSHSLRKSSATHMLRNGAKLEQVQSLLGHVEITSTEIYTKVYPQDIIKMHREFHPRG